MINIAIAGGTGYTAGELLRLLMNHPAARIISVVSSTNAGASVSSVHRDLLGSTTLKFSSMEDFLRTREEVDLLFLCLGHGHSRQFLKEASLSERCRVIDLGNDFRTDRAYEGRKFVYGLPEINREKIIDAKLIANPGCFATSILLGTAPLAAAGYLKNEIHVHSVTGSTGAGRTLSETGHYSYRESNISAYKPFNHQHNAEIEMMLGEISSSPIRELNFIPLRGCFTRGIFTSIYTANCSGKGIDEINNIYRDYYSSSPFVFLSDGPLSLKEVVNTNKAFVHAEIHRGYIYITVVIDNLLKGASGQAVQNMNLMMGLKEDAALSLKGSAF